MEDSGRRGRNAHWESKAAYASSPTTDPQMRRCLDDYLIIIPYCDCTFRFISGSAAVIHRMCAPVTATASALHPIICPDRGFLLVFQIQSDFRIDYRYTSQPKSPDALSQRRYRAQLLLRLLTGTRKLLEDPRSTDPRSQDFLDNGAFGFVRAYAKSEDSRKLLVYLRIGVAYPILEIPPCFAQVMQC